MKGDVIQYRSGYKYSLWQEYRVQIGIRNRYVVHRLFTLSPDGWLTIHEDYPWDGASGAIDTKTILRASLVHDVLFEMLRLGLLPHDPCFHEANRELEIICLEDGMWEFRAHYVLDAVECLGNAFAGQSPERIKYAPHPPQTLDAKPQTRND